MRRPALLATAAAVLASALPSMAAAQAKAPAPSASKAVVPPLDYRERTLANGLHVYSAVDKTTPNVTVQVFYDVGGKDDPAQRSGFAHLFEHLMFKATRDMPAEDMDRLTEDVGGFNNASTHDDYTNFYEVIPANNLQRLLWAEAERMSSLVVDQADFASERQVVVEELRQRVLADPYGRLFTLMIPKASYEVSPYKRPVIGSIRDLDAADLADVRAFHATYYRPDNASLIVIGNFDPRQLDGWVDRYFGDIRHPDAAIPHADTPEPPRTAPRIVMGYGPTVPLPAVLDTWLIPPGSSRDGPALMVVDALLTTGRSSRLYQDLVYQQQIASSVVSEPDLRQQPGLFIAGLILAGGHGVEEGSAALRRELQGLRDAPVSAAELVRAKNQLLAQELKTRETVDGRADELGRAIIIEGDARRVDIDLSAIQAVTAEDVQRVARTYLSDPTRVEIRYLPESARPKGAPAGDAAALDVASTSVATVAPTAAQALPPPASLPHTPPPPGPIVSPAPPQPVTRTLDNGMKVIVARTSALPLVTVELMVRRGSTSDPAGLGGLQSVTTGLLTQGAGGRSAPEIAAAVEALGGSIDSSAATDGSQIVLTVLADQLGAAMPILSDVARRPDFAPAELERLRRQRLDSLAVQMDEPGGLARLAIRPIVFGASPYGHNPEGTPTSLRRIVRAAVLAQYARTFRPDDAVLVMTGDITPEEGYRLARQAFGDWTRPKAPLEPSAVAAAPPAPRVVVIDLPGAGQAAVLAGAPSIARADPRFYAAEVANAVLGGGYSARLNEELRVKRGLTYGAGSTLEEFRDTGLFFASAQTRNDAAAEVASLTRDLIGGLASTPIAPADLEAREAAIVGEFGRAVATSAGLTGDIAGNYALYGLDADEIARFTQRIDAVTADQARTAAPAAVDASRLSLVVAGDAKTFLPALRTKFPDVQVVQASALDLDTPGLTGR